MPTNESTIPLPPNRWGWVRFAHITVAFLAITSIPIHLFMKKTKDDLDQKTTKVDKNVLLPSKEQDPSLQNLCKIRALLVGIHYYSTSSYLGEKTADIYTTKDYLLRACPTAEIRILTDNPNVNSVARPTRDNVLKELNSMVNLTSPGDTLLVHFSGHGFPVLDENGDEHDGYDEAIYLLDDNHIIDDEIYNLIADGRIPKGANFLWLSEACHGGSFPDLPSVVGQVSYNYPGGELRSISSSKDSEAASGDPVLGGFVGVAFWDTIDHIGWNLSFEQLFSHDIEQLKLIRSVVHYNYLLRLRSTPGDRFNGNHDYTSPVLGAKLSEIKRDFQQLNNKTKPTEDFEYITDTTDLQSTKISFESLQLACRYGEIIKIREMIEKGIKITAEEYQFDELRNMIELSYRDNSIFNELINAINMLQYGPDKPDISLTSLEKAFEYRNIPEIKKLLRYGAGSEIIEESEKDLLRDRLKILLEKSSQKSPVYCELIEIIEGFYKKLIEHSEVSFEELNSAFATGNIKKVMELLSTRGAKVNTKSQIHQLRNTLNQKLNSKDIDVKTYIKLDKIITEHLEKLIESKDIIEFDELVSTFRDGNLNNIKKLLSRGAKIISLDQVTTLKLEVIHRYEVGETKQLIKMIDGLFNNPTTTPSLRR